MQVVVPKASGEKKNNNPTAMNKSKNNWRGKLHKERSLQEVAACRNSTYRSVCSVVKAFKLEQSETPPHFHRIIQLW